MAHILIVDDEIAILDVLKRYLMKENHQVYTATNGEEALQLYQQFPIDLIVTDIMMPKMDGYEFMDEVLQLNEHIPFLFISAKTQESDKIFALTLGADDYITKPFSPRELTLRVKNLLRRIKPSATTTSASFDYAPFYLDSARHIATLYEQELQLSLKEFQLLALLLKHPGRVFSKSELFDLIWDTDFSSDANTLNVHIHSLREKLAQAANNRPYPKIQTVWGLGYKLEVLHENS